MFRVQIETATAAFDETPGTELARILRKVAKRVEDGEVEGKCLDLNGKVVGGFNATGAR